MSRNRKHTRRRPKANPRGVLTVSAALRFVQTAEGSTHPRLASPAFDVDGNRASAGRGIEGAASRG
ncbi:MAG: hypothetical protein ACLUW6_05425 [Coriobacteriaceae bacterium]